IGRMCEHVIAEHQVRLSSLSRQLQGKALAKKFFECLNSFFRGNFGNVPGGLDPQAGHSCRLEMLQEIPVVAGDLHYEALTAETEFPDITFSRFSRVAHHEIRKRREIKILGE